MDVCVCVCVSQQSPHIQKSWKVHRKESERLFDMAFCDHQSTAGSTTGHSTRPHLTLIAKRAFFRRSNLVPTVFSSPFPLSLLCLLSRYFTFLKFRYCEKATKFETKISHVILALLKGQLISKYPFGVFKLTKKIFCKDFCPSL